MNETTAAHTGRRLHSAKQQLTDRYYACNVKQGSRLRTRFNLSPVNVLGLIGSVEVAATLFAFPAACV